ncbi:MAG: hypothetical protein WDO18_05070 [Acidobacteriota bacterium]
MSLRPTSNSPPCSPSASSWGKFLFRTVPQRMVHFMRRSPRFRDLMQDLFAGTQTYTGLRSRLLRNLNGTLQEVLMQFFLERVIPSNSRVTP